MTSGTSSFTEAWLDGPELLRFYTRTYVPSGSPPKAVLVFLHGFGDHIARYEPIHTRWTARGVAVFAYDKRGFGRTALDRAHRSAGAAYGKMSRPQELGDLAFWVEHAAKHWPGVPVFVFGYSASGGAILDFATHVPPSPMLSKIAGVIVQAPLLRLAHPPPQVVRSVALSLSKVLPHMSFPAVMPEERLSRDPAVVQAIKADPWRIPKGTVLGLHDMISKSEELLDHHAYGRWPSDLPLLMTWGTKDEANSPDAGVAFYEMVSIADKKLVEYEGALHDLLHETDGIPEKVSEEYLSWMEAHLCRGAS